MTEHHGALHGRRVVVTRSSSQAGSLAGLLEAAGAVPVVVPLVEQVAEPTGTAELAALDPFTFEWLVVSSPNGAHAYLAAHRGAPDRVAAVGAATASALAAGGVAVSLVPDAQSAAGLVAAFPTADASAGRVLVVQAVDAEPVLADGLRAKGWQVTTVAPYRTVPAVPSAGVQMAALSADAVLFASGSAARAWATVFGTSTPPIVVAIGPQTAAAATAANLKITVVAADHSLKGLIDALAAYLSPPS